MHPSSKSLTVNGAPSLHVFLLDIHHDTSFRSILENDFITLTSKAHIYFVWARGQGYDWLLGHLYVYFASHILLSSYCCIFVLV